jgi:hypothetical protein
VLTVDFTLAKVRAQASFADLAPQLPDGTTVWGTDESAWPRTAGAPAMQLAEWLDEPASDGLVRAVLGFCASASLAGALAARLAARHGATPRLVLFDPVAVGPHTMIDQAGDSIRRLGNHVVFDNGVDTDDVDLDGLATRLADRYTQAAGAVGAAQRIPPAIVDQLCQRVAANLRFLTMAAAAWSAERLTPDLVVLSRDHEAPEAIIGELRRRQPAHQARGAAETRSGEELVRLPVTQDVLLADAGAAAAVARLFAGVAA